MIVLRVDELNNRVSIYDEKNAQYGIEIETKLDELTIAECLSNFKKFKKKA